MQLQNCGRLRGLKNQTEVCWPALADDVRTFTWITSGFSANRKLSRNALLGNCQNKVLAEVKSLSPYRRFVIALHSPDVVVETGLLMCLPEKTALKLACQVQRDTFSGPI
jgi:hypothetical protein